MSALNALSQDLISRFRSGELKPDNLRLKEPVSPPLSEDIHAPDALSTEQQAKLRALGDQALAQAEVGAIVLAGGMATRFAYTLPKALFPILGEKTFLELKILSLKAQGIPLYLMTSFHAHAPITAFLDAHDWFGYHDKIFLFQQFHLPRIYSDGSLRQVAGEIEYATSGHGDFVEALKQAGLLSNFVQAGGKYLLFSNIDNLGATPDPLLLGLHIDKGSEMSIEVAAKAPGDKGGAPARVNNRLQLVEEFLFPVHFDQDSIQVFNTASYIFSAPVLERPFELPWYAVEKKVEGQTVIQFEHLAGDLSRELNVCVVKVERDQRFLPVKRQEDVETVRPLIEAKFVGLV
ncbi:MAG: UTP--glucose-1-phosphate uridylyltransferase [Candidatus Sericytochromatia bacterium]|nr:UTP--glucose-1-phosphate uridylyltransferase [Candidatus Sericytochromatia bacterium]